MEAASDGWKYQNVTKAGKEHLECCALALTVSTHFSLAKACPSLHLASCKWEHVIFLYVSERGEGIENVAVISILVFVPLRIVTPFHYEKYECMIELRSLCYYNLTSPLQREE